MWLKIFRENFKTAVSLGKTKQSTQGNYSSALGRFLKWLQKETWYQEIFLHNLPDRAPCTIPISRKWKPRVQDYEYGLKVEELPEHLSVFLREWQTFWMPHNSIEEENSQKCENLPRRETLVKTSVERRNKREKRRVEEQGRGTFDRPVLIKYSDKTFKNYSKSVLRFWGWCINVECYSVDEITINWITDKILLEDYATHLIQDRGRSSHSGVSIALAALSVAKYLTYKDSRRRDWSDIPLVEELRNLCNQYKGEYNKQKPQSDEEKWEEKELAHEEARKVVWYLYQHCAKLNARGEKRSASAILKAWRVYLIVKILVYAPIRQQEIRNLREGDTLIRVKDKNGAERYAVRIRNHKNLNKTGKSRYYPLPTVLTQDLDIWLQLIRPTAIEAAKNLDDYLKFFGYSLELEKQLSQRLEEAKKGKTLRKVKNLEDYISSLKKRIKAIHGRIESWEVAKANAEKCNSVFFIIGTGNSQTSFCEPYTDDRFSLLCELVSWNVGGATNALFGCPKFLNPHGFRHIGSKHLRLIGKANCKEAFSSLQGHSVEIDDEYAAQITKDYDLIEEIVDDWWE
ncbi:hypothetical protein C7B82_28445 [Stenomitos frigidus ULC18]|uniref:Uncharacterized protein n=2 Tax=Stenomitos TaxID=1844270 RepID=A0A2T1DUB2_9CYAN|nr:hypothetical protein C7B82_28445 [Stenomitos frigidus ULC18]